MIKNKIRLLSKLAAQEQILGTYGAQNSSVHEDLNTEATMQAPLEVEFGKKSIKDLVFMSKTIGDNPAYVQGGGGNISVKLDQTKMAIKASGYILKNVTEEDGYCIVDYPRVRDYLSHPDNDETIFSMKIKSFAKNSGKRPSMETGFHVLLGKFVLHTHSVFANLINCSKEGKDICYQLFPKALWIDYATPGRLLTIKIREALQSAISYPNVIFLQNHGVIVSGESSTEVLNIHEELNNIIQRYFRLNNSSYISHTQIANIEYIRNNILFPDQAVYTLAGEEILNSLAAKETISAYSFIHKTIGDKGLNHNFLSRDLVDTLLQMDSEKYRQNVLKK
ncbi:Class II aldolase domain protein [Candidatus Megaera venefica]|uniref:Class II aldolase domain protein n=1 Tax=Candidatus Megaera venefica TaxID=2055910 RepID=A0ABU5NCY4_9RICK|nr:class II aldolase/adducin family protein [Candidatus Megaera venefica]MEA0971024.1 Class II aldolase domain protein [Candidatus Megaera venefica]